MDIISHGLWAVLLIKALHKKYAKPIHLRIAFLVGIIPDIIAFTFLTIWSTINFGIFHPEDHGANMLGTLGPTLNIITETLYSFSHSLIVIGIILLVLYVIFRKIPIVMLAWPLHILLDIPSHTSKFYPTPFLWPISEFTVSGIRWSNPLFIKINYALIMILALYLFRKRVKNLISKLFKYCFTY